MTPRPVRRVHPVRRPPRTDNPKTAQHPELLIVTGMSGAGRSSAANALEDHGWHVIDNLPPVLLAALTELVTKTPDEPQKLAVVMDIRGGDFFNDLRTNLSADLPYRLLFLDACVPGQWPFLSCCVVVIAHSEGDY